MPQRPQPQNSESESEAKGPKSEHVTPTPRTGTLNQAEIIRRLHQQELILRARQKDGEYDVEPASYDLTAGIAVWKEPAQGQNKGEIRTLHYSPEKPGEEQPTLSLQPGQMVFVITHEELKIPATLSGTVYSRNSLAREGILALNAGHIDPGFQGPIVIRLINLRAVPWVLTLGSAIFTIVFHTVCCQDTDVLIKHRAISHEETLSTARKSAENALSNALFDIYAADMETRLIQHQAGVEERLRQSLSQEFVRTNGFGKALGEWVKGSIIAWLVIAAALAGVIQTALAIWQAVPKDRKEAPTTSPGISTPARPTTGKAPSAPGVGAPTGNNTPRRNDP